MIRLAMLACMLALGVLPSLAHSQELIAHYPLVADGVEATGRYGPMNLTNAPFEDGGVYCNGIYTPNEGGYLVQTPPVNGLDFSSFSISAEFRIPTDYSLRRPVFVAGSSYRWIGVEIEWTREFQLLYNNIKRVNSGVVVTTDVWHQAFVAYDGATNTGHLYLNGESVASAVFEIEHGNDRDISTSNFGNGTAFRGHFRNLRVYDAAFVPTPVEGSTWGQVKKVFAAGGS